MAVYSKVIPTGSTNGLGVVVAATGSAGTTFHTAIAGTSSIDEIWMYASNIDTVNHDLTVEWGTSGSQTEIKQTLLAQSGLTLILPGLLLQNANTVKVYADLANKINLTGFVNRIV